MQIHGLTKIVRYEVSCASCHSSHEVFDFSTTGTTAKNVIHMLHISGWFYLPRTKTWICPMCMSQKPKRVTIGEK